MNAPPPITFEWDGDAMVPLPRHRLLCDKHFVVHATYPMIVHEERSGISHRHFFAAVHDAWSNLPESIAHFFATSEHLRKSVLIDAGYYEEMQVDAGSKAAAVRVAAAFRAHDEFARAVLHGSIVAIRTAKSQSYAAMGKKVFQESKQAVLDILDDMLGLEAGTMAVRAKEPRRTSPSIAPSQPAQSTKRPDEPALSGLGRGRARSEVP